jgi:hypothetical protein
MFAGAARLFDVNMPPSTLGGVGASTLGIGMCAS